MDDVIVSNLDVSAPKLGLFSIVTSLFCKSHSPNTTRMDAYYKELSVNQNLLN